MAQDGNRFVVERGKGFRAEGPPASHVPVDFFDELRRRVPGGQMHE
jgi:hypothetical protein